MRGVSRTTFLVSTASTLNDTANNMVAPVLPLFLTNVLGASPAIVGLIEGIAGAVSSILTLASGIWSDRVQRHAPFVVGGYLLSTVSRTLMFVAFSWWFVLLLRGLDRFGRSIRSAARDAMIAGSVPQHLQGRNFGFYNSADHLGAMVGPLLTSVVLLLFPEQLRMVFIAAIIPSLLTLFLLLKLRDKTTTEQRPRRPISFSQFRKLPQPFFLLMLVMTIFGLANSSDSFLILRAEQIGTPTPLIPLAVSLVSLVAMLVAYPAGILADRIGFANTTALGIACYALTYLGFAHVHHAPVMIWPLFLLYGGTGAIAGAMKPLVMSSVPKDRRSTASGLMALSGGLAVLLGNVIAGILWSWYGPTATFMLGFGLAMTALYVLLLIQKQITPPQRPS
ncbi:MAG: MFS transporter [Meiothermus sp.]|uniref:MFS transporter n=1 Tax=Meiothermus sp. TaxID=1955249 RepID=UPI0021DDB3D5|nr:MFS transporter [Meiothermus sp.]GIW28935.1 MAG: MFS transporter [Meiothermus sp.]